MCEALYKKILPVIFEAATEKHVTIENASDIKVIAELLAEKLLKHNIFKIITSSRECTIEIVPSRKL